MLEGYLIPRGLEERIREHRRRIHRFAEVGFDTENTLGYIEGELKKLGYEPHRCGRAGILADIGAGDDVTLLRADVDALPMAEESGEEFAATNGNAHACGHDMHAAMLLGAAEIFSQNKNKIQGRIRLIFQSAEETLEGCKDMIVHGALDDPKVKRAFMLHLTVGGDLPLGTVIFPARGICAPASNVFRFKIIGRGGHGADPSSACDALSVAVRLHSAFRELPATEFAASDNVTISVGLLNCGTAANVIADSAELLGTVRTFESSVRERVLTRMKELGQGIGELYSASVTFDIVSGCPPFISDPELSDRTHPILEKAFPKQVIRTPDGTLGTGSEDFAYVSERIPTLMIVLSAGSKKEGYEYPVHHPKCRFSEDILLKGTLIYTLLGFECK